jgi:tRNA (guanine-N7-)-methyltransferase
VIEPGKDHYFKMKGQWKQGHFRNNNPLVIELGCGRGEYTVGLAGLFRDHNFVGIDIKGDRIWVGAGQAIEKGMDNVAFLRTQLQFLDRFFEDNEVDTIWLTFPDPRPKERDEKRRLTFPKYMDLYRKVLKRDGWFKFKTDNSGLFEYTLNLLESNKVFVKDLQYTWNLYDSDLVEEHHGIKTKYEKIWSEKGEKIKYMKFRFDHQAYAEKSKTEESVADLVNAVNDQ